MNLNHYLCTYEALYLNSLVVSGRIGIIYGDTTFTLDLWGNISELLFSIEDPMWYRARFLWMTQELGFKSTIKSNPDYDPDPLVEVLL